MKFVLLVSGDTDSVLAVLHVDTIPRSIRKVDGITEVWLVLSMLTGLGGTWSTQTLHWRWKTQVLQQFPTAMYGVMLIGQGKWVCLAG